MKRPMFRSEELMCASKIPRSEQSFQHGKVFVCIYLYYLYIYMLTSINI